VHQYVTFWTRVASADFGPSLSAFPTRCGADPPALPWTVGLLATATLTSWVLGNLLGGLAGYHRDSARSGWPGWSPWGSPDPYYISPSFC